MSMVRDTSKSKLNIECLLLYIIKPTICTGLCNMLLFEIAFGFMEATIGMFSIRLKSNANVINLLAN